MIVPEALIAYLIFKFFSFAYLYVYNKGMNNLFWFYSNGLDSGMGGWALEAFQRVGVISFVVGVVFLVYYAFAVSFLGFVIFYFLSEVVVRIVGGLVIGFWGIKNVLDWGGLGLLVSGVFMFVSAYGAS